MMFSDDTGNLMGWLGGIAALATALGGVIVLIWNTLHKNRQERDSTAIAQLEQFADRLQKQLQEQADKFQKQLEQQAAHIHEQSDAILQMHEENTGCQLELSDVYGNLDRVFDYCERVRDLCRARGEDPGIPPKKIERKCKPDRSAIEFRMRSLRQRTETLGEQSAEVSAAISPKVNES